MLTRGSLDVAAGASGVVDVPLAEPLRLTAGKTYTVSYSAPTGRAAAADRRQDLHRQLLRADRPSRCG